MLFGTERRLRKSCILLFRLEYGILVSSVSPPILSLLNCRLPSSETERFYQVAHLINLLRMYADVALILTLCQYKVAGGMTYIVFC